MAGNFDYKPLKTLIETGNVGSFSAIFDFYGLRTNLSKDSGFTYPRFLDCIEKCELFTGKEIYTMARIIGVEGKVLLNLWIEQMEKDKAERDKTRTKKAK